MDAFLRKALETYEVITRVMYGITAVIWPLLVLLLWSRWFTQRPTRTGADFVIMLIVPVFVVLTIVLPAVRAGWRVRRGEPLLPWWRLRQRPLIGAIVALACVLAVAVPVTAEVMLKDYFDVAPGELHPLTWFWWAGFGLSSLALTLGELVVMGRDTSAQADGSIA